MSDFILGFTMSGDQASMKLKQRNWNFRDKNSG